MLHTLGPVVASAQDVSADSVEGIRRYGGFRITEEPQGNIKRERGASPPLDPEQL